MLRVLMAGATAVMVGAASAGDSISPSESEVRQARDASRAAIGAANRSPATSRDERLKAGAGATATRPRALRPPPATEDRAAADIRALMQRARAGSLLDTRTPPSATPSPLVFISLSMPESSLRALVDQSRPVGAALVLRGLVDDSMQRTAERLGELLGVDADPAGRVRSPPDVSLMIDPTLFERFEVNAVPTFVVPLEAPAPCTNAGTCVTPVHAKVTGDVALPYALEVIARQVTDPGLRAAATRWSRQSEGAK